MNLKIAMAKKIRRGSLLTRTIYRINGRLGLFALWLCFQLGRGMIFEGRRAAHSAFHENPCLPSFWSVYWTQLRETRLYGVPLHLMTATVTFVGCHCTSIVGRYHNSRQNDRRD